MKRILLFVLSLTCCVGVQAQGLKAIPLNNPNQKGGMSLREALAKRHSVREYSDKQLSKQELSDLLWAANGINRPESGKRTAPSAMNRQEIDIYVCMPEGAYVYDAKANVLTPVAEGDFRSLVAGPQDFAAKAPLSLVLVGDLSSFKGDASMPSMDAGIVSQNISLFCTSAGLATVPRATLNHEELKKVLKLKDSQRLFLNHPVGYAK